jgi:hypothetical protein
MQVERKLTDRDPGSDPLAFLRRSSHKPVPDHWAGPYWQSIGVRALSLLAFRRCLLQFLMRTPF